MKQTEILYKITEISFFNIMQNKTINVASILSKNKIHTLFLVDILHVFSSEFWDDFSGDIYFPKKLFSNCWEKKRRDFGPILDVFQALHL